jgi:hypothetical protein
MSLQKGYALHSQISELLNYFHTNENEFRLTSYGQKFLTVATTLIYYSFTSVIFAGVSVWAFQQYALDNGANVNGLIYTVALVISAPIGLALIKHTNFKAMAHAHSLKEFGIRALIVLAVISGLWYEGISSSSNLQEKAFHAVENSKSGNAILNSGVVVASGGNTALSDAEFKLVSCKRKLKEGSVGDCVNSEARVASLKEQSALDRASINDANTRAITVKQAALSKERDEHALPAAKSFAEMLNVSLATGTMAVVLLSSLFFELIHLSSIFSERSYLQRKAALLANLSALKNEYFRLIGKTYSPDDFQDDETLNMSEMRESGAIRNFKESAYSVEDKEQGFEIKTKGKPYEDSKIGFGIPTPQTASKFKWQQEPELPAKEERSFGFLSRTSKPVNSASLDADLLNAENRRKYPQTILYPNATGKSPDDYSVIPRNDHKHPTPTTGTERKTPTETATAESLEQTVYTAPEQPRKTTGTAPEDDTGTPADRAAFNAHNDLYPLWREEVKRGEMAATARACRDFVVKHRGVDVLSMRQAKYIWNEWGKRAVGENLLNLNPEYSPGNRKLKYLLAA